MSHVTLGAAADAEGLGPQHGEVPTEIPSYKILDRDLSIGITTPIRARGRPALREVVDEAIRVFERCGQTARGHDEHIGLLFPFLQLAETLDAVEVCLDQASTSGASILLRAAFEAMLAVEWVAGDPQLRYGAAYVVCDIHRRIEGYEQFAKGSSRRKQVEERMKADTLGTSVSVPEVADATKRIDDLTSVLHKPHLADASKEYARLRARGGKPEFYAFWSGPRNIEQLALLLGRGGQYDFLYRAWSRLVHGTDVMRQLTSVDGHAAVRTFRDGDGLATAYTFAIVFGLVGIRAVLQHYRPDELTSSHRPWYEAHVSKPLAELAAVR